MARGDSSTRTSKWLARALRHAPQEAGIVLDAHGWADVAEVLEAATRAGHVLDAAGLVALVETDTKQRYALREGRVRANQGHSVPVDLDLTQARPPEHLYHGTVERFARSIQIDGLLSQQRHHVHLSADVKTARAVGARRGPPVVFMVHSGAMAAAGETFWLSANGVWLVERVSARYLTRLP